MGLKDGGTLETTEVYKVFKGGNLEHLEVGSRSI